MLTVRGYVRLVSSGVSIIMGSGSGTNYSTVLVNETLSSEYSLVFLPDSPLIIPSPDYILVNIGATGPAESGYGFVTIHIGY